MGHLKRCITLYRVLQQRYEVPSYFIAPSEYMQEMLKRECIPFFVNWQEVPSQQTFVLDVVTMQCLQDPTPVEEFLFKLKDYGHKIIFIDGIHEHSFLSVAPSVPELEAVVIPYIGAQPIPNVKIKKWLVGAKYVLISPIYQGSDLKNQPKGCHNLLITMGGSDPKNLTLQVLEALKRHDLNCRIILGPLFSESLKQQVECIALKKSNWTVQTAPSDLLEHYIWADLVICSVGVSTYEVLAMRKPSLQLSISPVHAKHGWDLHRMQLIYHVGYFDDVSECELEHAILSVVKSNSHREQMSKMARKTMDSQGVLYVADAVCQFDHEPA